MKKILSFTLFVVILCNLCLQTITARTPDKEMSGVWLCSVGNLDYPSKSGLDERALALELDKIIDNCKINGINTIFFQVRPNSDALYKSDLFPWSAVLSGQQGTAPDAEFDPLSYAVEKAHTAGIELQAWINPYRIGDKSVLCDKNPATLHPEWTVTCSDGKMYYNPALPEVRKLICDGVREIIDNYDVDGIHFDDYFYPYDVDDFPDADSFAKYGAAFEDIADFRRDNVNKLVLSVNELVHKKDKNLRFGISPFGIWANKKDNQEGSDTNGMSSYSRIYADSKYWVKNKMLDYICPQIYWSFENENAPFETVANWWNDLCKGSGVDLYAGIALYKCGTDENGWQSPDQIDRQLSLCDSLSSVKGTVLFRYGELYKLTEDLTETKTEPFTSDSIIITSPENNFTTSSQNVSVTGVANKNKKLYLDNREIPLTENGYFSVYLPLKTGTNKFTFTDGNETKNITIKKSEPKSQKTEYEGVFVKDSALISGECTFFAGEQIELSLQAKPDSLVFATLGDKEIQLTGDSEGNFKASVLLPAVFGSKTLCVNYFSLSDGNRTDFSQNANVNIIDTPIQMYTANETYLYDNCDGGSMMDNYQLPKGTPVSVTAAIGDMYRLNSGKWVYKQNVTGDYFPQSLDVDASKYLKVTVSAKTEFTYDYDLGDSGVLNFSLYHNVGDEIEIDADKGISAKTVKLGGITKLLVFRNGRRVTGFYTVSPSSDSLEIYIFNNDKNGIEGKTVVLDVGHGGSDCGALGPAGKNGPTEDDLNLALAKKLESNLTRLGANVVLTRKTDTYLKLEDRAELIRSYKPDVCISVHHNSVSSDSDYNESTGFLTLYSRQTSKPLADIVSTLATSELALDNQGAKTQSLNVCRDYRYPCILVECGFVCNPSEYELLLKDSYKSQISNNITLALCEYFDVKS